MIKKGIKSVCFMFIICACMAVSAQVYDDSFSVQEELAQRVQIPNSPEAQAFSKYGNTTLDLFHGTPNIQIPVYTHAGRELNISLSLTYDASGIKVEQRATNVGLGWNLNMGGRISRVANGYPDDYISAQTPYLSFWNTVVNDGINTYLDERSLFDSEQDAIDYLEFLKFMKNNYYDTQPDFFSFNALGVSDMIVIDRNTKQAIALNNPRIKVTYNKVNMNSAGTPITSWTVTLEDGTLLTFARPETTDSVNYIDIGSASGGNDFHGAFKTYYSSWLLTSIVSSTGKDTYTFGFTGYYGQENDIAASLLQGVLNPIVATGESPTANIGTNAPEYTIEQSYVNTITHNGKRIVDIDYGTRYDVKGGNTPTAVNAIHIYDQDTGNDTQDLNRSVSLIQDYFKTSAGINPATHLNKNEIRLKLEEVEISYSDPSAQTQIYTFEYESPDSMPSVLSLSQDYYGYYNGKNNTVLYPRVAYSGITGITDLGADRTVSTDDTKIGTLKKIVYPTGGHTIFNYDSHKSTDISPEETITITNFVPYGDNILVGGGLGDGAFEHPDSECTGPACQENSLESPNVSHVTFNIEEAGGYLLSYTMSSTGSTPGPREAFVFKKSGSCATIRYDDIKSQLGGQQWLIDPDDLVFWDTSPGGANVQNQSVFLEPGCYQITLVNSSPISVSTLTIGRYETTTTTSEEEEFQISKAGLRVVSTEDYTRDGALALRKEYDYSSGTVLSQPIYQTISTQYSGNAATQVETEILHRTSYASGTDKAHIGYEWVSEKVVSSEETIITTHTFHLGGSTQSNTGVFQYHINGIQTSNNYGVNYPLGKPKKVTSTASINTSTYYQKGYYNQQGIHYINDESMNFYYPIPTLSPTTGKWFIQKIPHAIFATYAGGELGTGLSGLVTGSPPECTVDLSMAEVCNPGIARMVVYTPSASGKVGGMLTTTATQRSSSSSLPSSLREMDVSEMQYTYYDTPGEGYPVTYLMKSQKRIRTNGDTLITTYKYPEHFPANYPTLITHNIVGTPVDVTTTINGTQPLAHRQTEYSGLYPSRVLASQRGNSLEERIVFDQYVAGNPVESHITDGTYTAYIWGYGNRYLVAKIENATYADVLALPSMSSGSGLLDGLSATQETELRSLPSALVTTYTYKPNVGVLTTTDPRGYTMYYEYDAQNRLRLVKDDTGNILSKNEYNYRTNN